MPRTPAAFCPECGQPRHEEKAQKMTLYLSAHTVANLIAAGIPKEDITAIIAEYAEKRAKGVKFA